MVGIQKEKNKRGNYRKVAPEDKEQIIFELINGFKSASELSRLYGIPISTIKSYLKSKELMYTPLVQSISDSLYQSVDMWFQNLNEMKDDKERKKLIRRYIVNEELFQYKDTNPFKNQIPPTKIFSKKSRIIQEVIDNAISYFNDLQRQDLVYNTNQIEQDLYNTVQDQIEIEYVQQTQEDQSQQNNEDQTQQNLTIQLFDESQVSQFSIFLRDSNFD
ncbi:unnamed protein product [Paramecium sonneborni]|uniref:HTH psq-type domain-containing protein n=1 Tax=Paramecium sonneborni TaxID=65129 RepID=A0A8S1KKB9_9CILI|nr:unnamed protein product [Paramecium sonneborni]